jgi:hypothetical protein
VQPGAAYGLSDKLTIGAEYQYGDIATKLSGTPIEASDYFSVIDAYATIDWGKALIKLKPGYDTRDGYGFFIRAVCEASL